MKNTVIFGIGLIILTIIVLIFGFRTIDIINSNYNNLLTRSLN